MWDDKLIPIGGALRRENGFFNTFSIFEFKGSYLLLKEHLIMSGRLILGLGLAFQAIFLGTCVNIQY